MSAAETSTKSASAFRTISEVSGDLDVPQHVLRFWETKFPQVKPLKRAGRRRYYRPEDLAILRKIRDLLYKDGYTIKGVQKLFKEGAFKAIDPKAKKKSAGKEVHKATINSGAKSTSDSSGNTSESNKENNLLQQVGGLSLDDQKKLINELISIRSLLD